MSTSAFRRDNHFVPRFYLKRWASSPEHVWAYRVLVSHPSVRLWKEASVRGVAYHSHLYTRVVAGVESDEIERWLDREFEAPAEEAIHKATTGARLSPRDWKSLVRFLAAQDVRTPGRLSENLKRWGETLPALIQNTLRNSVQKLEHARQTGEALPEPDPVARDYLPFKVTTEIEPGAELGVIKGEAIAGRGLWLWSIRHLLSGTYSALLRHRWTIVSPAAGLTWFTSDDPVVKLNFYGQGRYDFRGGWGNPGTDIFLPLSPYHLLYTTVGQRPHSRGTVLSREHTRMFRKFAAEHAHRMIFAHEQDPEIPYLRPRVVDADALKNEHEQWKQWHGSQTAAERELAER